MLNYAISEHIENAGVHSGDATLVLPAQKLYQETTRRIKIIGRKVCKALNITGPFNMQVSARPKFAIVCSACAHCFPYDVTRFLILA